MLKVLRPDSRGFAIEALEESAGGAGGKADQAILFYRDNFKKMDLFSMGPADFVRELRRRYVDSGRPIACGGPRFGGRPEQLRPPRRAAAPPCSSATRARTRRKQARFTMH